jgi:pyridoxamine 5'-phosphate oxidase family protein
VQKNPRAAVVIDDLATIDPWTPRGIKVIGNVTIEEVDGSPRFRIRPDVIISWGVNVTSPGRPTMERRSVS